MAEEAYGNRSSRSRLPGRNRSFKTGGIGEEPKEKPKPKPKPQPAATPAATEPTPDQFKQECATYADQLLDLDPVVRQQELDKLQSSNPTAHALVSQIVTERLAAAVPPVETPPTPEEPPPVDAAPAELPTTEVPPSGEPVVEDAEDGEATGSVSAAEADEEIEEEGSEGSESDNGS